MYNHLQQKKCIFFFLKLLSLVAGVSDKCVNFFWREGYTDYLKRILVVWD